MVLKNNQRIILGQPHNTNKGAASEQAEISNVSRRKHNIQAIIEERLCSQGVKFSRDRISLSGNLDYATIERLVNEYGFHGKIRIKDKSKLAKALLKVKHERNSLAHGNKSFRQSAEIVTINDLEEFKNLIVDYLTDITDNTIKYLEDKSYLKK